MATAAAETDLDLFARVEDGVIVEFPVYRLYIRNRAHPVSFYTPVVELEKPTLPEFSYYKQTLTVKDTYVEAAYTVAAYTLNEILTQIRRGVAGVPGLDVPDVVITDVDPATIQRVYVLGGDYMTAKLDAFAQTRLYDSIDKLCGYANSSFEKFQVEGSRGVVLRDECWKSLVTYFSQVISGELPIPRSTATIDELLPPLVWTASEGEAILAAKAQAVADAAAAALAASAETPAAVA